MAIQEADTEHPPIIVDRKGHIGVVTFNNPAKHNAMSLDMWRGAREAVAGFADDDDIRCVVFTGAGNKAFVAGADISKFENERSSVTHIEAYNKAVSDYHRTVQGLMKPTIARIDGYCIGGGLGVAVLLELLANLQRGSRLVGAPALRPFRSRRGEARL